MERWVDIHTTQCRAPGEKQQIKIIKNLPIHSTCACGLFYSRVETHTRTRLTINNFFRYNTSFSHLHSPLTKTNGCWISFRIVHTSIDLSSSCHCDGHSFKPLELSIRLKMMYLQSEGKWWSQISELDGIARGRWRHVCGYRPRMASQFTDWWRANRKSHGVVRHRILIAHKLSPNQREEDGKLIRMKRQLMRNGSPIVMQTSLFRFYHHCAIVFLARVAHKSAANGNHFW